MIGKDDSSEVNLLLSEPTIGEGGKKENHSGTSILGYHFKRQLFSLFYCRGGG